MPTPAACIDMAASLMNDTAQTVYTDVACLPYLNMALQELQEHFELNNIPVTNETTPAVLNVVAGVSVIGAATTPALPTDLIEIQQLWESPEGLNQWLPMQKVEFLPHYLENTTVSQFQYWAWMEQEIKLIAANIDIDLKIDYIKSLFTTVLIGAINTNLPIMNSLSYLGYKTAALCSQFIGENPTRAAELNALTITALDRTLGISTKGRQAINTRRRPFMAAYKTRGF